ncbi:hypothetical protein HN695_04175 [Candidatus Woesearchaeota archaeon]|jgi:Zn ribbon nucleic-acid-binding protein|nr:hypothetical protein [Candidatus Woesearchaeota archaeon]MBT5272346.1 hypothetical protein [Candidatus Woesearchaeota archaeon]MBT6041314.1 hypothetical protein [Candidatus Woesearchaeota archaeon]MBT6336618.1 hypothetical protein [Candidatus Woesearchaeota archaeon]MBT7927508.1 hypothetical protein [Candidatus Woesearchaeota archaeon]
MECPKCKKQAKIVEYRGTKVKVCSCGYDERDVLDQEVSEKSNQKAKGEYCKYKSRL